MSRQRGNSKAAVPFLQVDGKSSYLPAISGHVQLEGRNGLFYDYNTEDGKLVRNMGFQAQPSFAVPREDWPNPPPPLPQNLDDKTTTAEIAALVSAVYPFSDGPQGQAWSDHLIELYRLLYALKTRDWATNFMLIPLLRITLRGIADNVFTSPDVMCIFESKERFRTHKDLPDSSYKYGPNDQLVSGAYGYFDSLANFHKNAYGKRFFVGFINHKNVHWGSFIWDRFGGQLYIFDSFATDRMNRIEEFVCLWRQMLYELDLPFNFSFLAVPCTKQAYGWECGYLSFFWIHLTIRGLIGYQLRHHQIGEDFDGITWSRSSMFDTLPHTPFTLPLRDWCLLDGSVHTVAVYTDRMRSTLMHLVANELGISKCPKSFSRIALWDLNDQLVYNQPVDKALCFTYLGGAIPFSIGNYVVPTVFEKTRVFSAPGSDQLILPFKKAEALSLTRTGGPWKPSLPAKVAARRTTDKFKYRDPSRLTSDVPIDLTTETIISRFKPINGDKVLPSTEHQGHQPKSTIDDLVAALKQEAPKEGTPESGLARSVSGAFGSFISFVTGNNTRSDVPAHVEPVCTSESSLSEPPEELKRQLTFEEWMASDTNEGVAEQELLDDDSTASIRDQWASVLTSDTRSNDHQLFGKRQHPPDEEKGSPSKKTKTRKYGVRPDTSLYYIPPVRVTRCEGESTARRTGGPPLQQLGAAGRAMTVEIAERLDDAFLARGRIPYIAYSDSYVSLYSARLVAEGTLQQVRDTVEASFRAPVSNAVRPSRSERYAARTRPVTPPPSGQVMELRTPGMSRELRGLGLGEPLDQGRTRRRK